MSFSVTGKLLFRESLSELSRGSRSRNRNVISKKLTGRSFFDIVLDLSGMVRTLLGKWGFDVVGRGIKVSRQKGFESHAGYQNPKTRVEYFGGREWRSID